MSSLLPFLVVLPLVAAAVSVALARAPKVQRTVAVITIGATVVLALIVLVSVDRDGPLRMNLGGWPGRIAITMVADRLATVMLVLGAVMLLVVLVYALGQSGEGARSPWYVPAYLVLAAGISAAFLAGDLFNLFVAFEVMLIASYALLTLEADDWDVKHAFAYVAINLFGRALFICACGLAYSIFGTLDFAEIALRATPLAGELRAHLLALLFLAVFGIKAGLFPLYYWLPNSYPTLPIPTAALFAGMLTKVGVYVLRRIFGTVLPHSLTFVHTLLAWLAGLTMVLAVMGAISRPFIGGILSFHILSQIGFMALAIGLFTPLSLAACILYIIHHIVVKSSLFLIGGTALRLNGTDDLDHMGNLWRRTPWLGALFLLQALSLAGLPPLSGF